MSHVSTVLQILFNIVLQSVCGVKLVLCIVGETAERGNLFCFLILFSVVQALMLCQAVACRLNFQFSFFIALFFFRKTQNKISKVVMLW